MTADERLSRIEKQLNRIEHKDTGIGCGTFFIGLLILASYLEGIIREVAK